jgi:hypothetical protein
MTNSRLLPAFLRCNISLIELVTRYCWWISHPQAFSKQGTSTSLNYQSISPSLVDFAVFGGMGREPKKTPPLRLPCLARTCGYPIHPYFLQQGKFLMIYSFLVAPKGSMLSTLSNPLIVRCHSDSTKEAKAKFKGLSVALITRHQSGGAI